MSERRCEALDRSEALVLLLCDADTDVAQWRAAGRRACRGDGTCNAWIWLDAALVPESAPATDAELPKERTGGAAAIWIGAAESLLVVRPVGTGEGG